MPSSIATLARPARTRDSCSSRYIAAISIFSSAELNVAFTSIINIGLNFVLRYKFRRFCPIRQAINFFFDFNPLKMPGHDAANGPAEPSPHHGNGFLTAATTLVFQPRICCEQSLQQASRESSRHSRHATRRQIRDSRARYCNRLQERHLTAAEGENRRQTRGKRHRKPPETASFAQRTTPKTTFTACRNGPNGIAIRPVWHCGNCRSATQHGRNEQIKTI